MNEESERAMNRVHDLYRRSNFQAQEARNMEMNAMYHSEHGHPELEHQSREVSSHHMHASVLYQRAADTHGGRTHVHSMDYERRAKEAQDRAEAHRDDLVSKEDRVRAHEDQLKAEAEHAEAKADRAESKAE